MILLTGASGFLGRLIATELLNAGRELRLLVRNPGAAAFPWADLVEVYEGDARDPEAVFRAMEGVDEVVHAAAKVSFWKKEGASVLQNNVAATANMVNASLEIGIEKFIQVSSIAAIATKTGHDPANEGEPWQAPVKPSAYARSKFESELEVQRGVAEGLPAVIVNPGVVIGPDPLNRNGISDLIKMINGGLRFFSPGMVPVVGGVDVGRAIGFLLGRPESNGERFILVSDNLSNAELLGLLAEELGVSSPGNQLPGWLLRSAGWINERLPRADGKFPALTFESARGATSFQQYDGSRITQLGFSYLPIRESIESAVASYREKGKM